MNGLDLPEGRGSVWLWIVVIILARDARSSSASGRGSRAVASPGEQVFRASRWTRGNRLFPAQVVITPSSVTLVQPQWIGKLEESIHLAHVASIKIDTHVMFSDVLIETSGGQDPVVCHGHTKGDAVQMKQLIEKFQSAVLPGAGRNGRARRPGTGASGLQPECSAASTRPSRDSRRRP